MLSIKLWYLQGISDKDTKVLLQAFDVMKINIHNL